ncbi:MAG: CehA/McbA family metallohydrolase [Myxococcales bacterium]|nr:CehA/McbA family metallohydrolase [Myxococcales bacterium]
MTLPFRLAAFVLMLFINVSATAELVAERVTEENAAQRLFGGPDASGGIGDWYLANDLVHFIIDDPSRQYAKLNHGGTLIDAGVRGRRGDDQFARLFTIVNLDQRVQLGYDTIRAETDPAGGFARLLVESRGGIRPIPRGSALARFFDLLVPGAEELAGVSVTTEYRVQPGEPFVRMITTFRNEGEDDAPLFAYSDVWMRGGRSMRSFVGNTLHPEVSRGFHHMSFDRNDLMATAEANAPFTFVAMAGMPDFPPISYALVTPERAKRGILNFGVTGKHITLINGFVGDPDWEGMNLWRFLQAIRGELEAGASWSFERRLIVTSGRDIASTTDLAFPMLGFAEGSSRLEGRVEPPDVGASILISTTDGAPVTQVAVPATGAWSAIVPPGSYRLTFRAPHRAERQQSVEVVVGRTTRVPTESFDALGFFEFSSAFSDGGPGRVIVMGVGDTADPVFGAELLDFRLDGERVPSGTETPAILFVGNEHDPTRVAVAPGRYRLIATRGPNYELAEVEVVVPSDGGGVRIDPFELRPAVELRGVVTSDFHVHAEASDDSGMSNEQRLRSFVAEAIDVMISTEHDHVGWFGPAIDALGVGDRIRVIYGAEITSSTPSPLAPWTIGHHNAWPIEYRPLAHRQGAPPSQNLSVAELYSRLRGQFGARVVQLNHALRSDGELDAGAYFSHLAQAGEPYDPTLPIDAYPNRLLLETASDGETRAIDFDAMEVMNGSSWGQYLRLREVWYSLLRQGIRRTATGNSDSHGPDQIAAYPRNYVYVDAEDFTPEVFDQAIREGRMFLTTGPLIAAFRANGGRMGDTVSAPDGRVEYQVAVSAPSWIPVDEVRILVNGEVVRTHRDLRGPEKVMRHLKTEVIELDADAFITVEAGAALDIDPAAWRADRGGIYSDVVAPGFISQVLANPIFIDVDGNGRFDPPGLPPRESGIESHRLIFLSVGLIVLALAWWRLRTGTGRQSASA